MGYGTWDEIVPPEIPEEVWAQDVAAGPPHPLPTPAPGGAPPTPPLGLGREEPDEITLNRTPLPHSFRCMEGHWHIVTAVSDLLQADTPLCLLRRIVLEWAALH